MTGQMVSYAMLVANVVWLWGWVQRQIDSHKWHKAQRENAEHHEN